MSITWAVDGVLGGSSAIGTINSSGVYTAPPRPGIHNVTATSVVDTTKSATANVTVIDFELTPAVATVDPLTTQQFTPILQPWYAGEHQGIVSTMANFTNVEPILQELIQCTPCEGLSSQPDSSFGSPQLARAALARQACG